MPRYALGLDISQNFAQFSMGLDHQAIFGLIELAKHSMPDPLRRFLVNTKRLRLKQVTMFSLSLFGKMADMQDT
jgi:hypothetical protein